MGEPRRAVRLITRLNIGGPARQALALTHRLAPGWHTTLAAGNPTAAEGELLDPRVTVTRMPLTRPLAPTSDLRALLAVRSLLRRERPDLLHTHMAKAGTVGRLAARSLRHRPRTVHTFHGHVLDGYFSPRVERVFTDTERWLARHTDVLIAVSEQVRDELLSLRIGHPEQYRVIPLGFDLSEHLAGRGRSGLLRSRFGIDDDALVVGCVGRLVPIKDVALLLRAFAGVPDAHLVIVGDGELRDELEAQARVLGRRVHFAGWQTDIPAVMADLDVIALTSRNEGTPVSLIEAAACARPVVATDVGGVASVVRDGETGLLVPAEDEAAVTAALQRLLGDPELRRRMGEAGRTSVGRFSLDRLVADVQALYDELVPPR